MLSRLQPVKSINRLVGRVYAKMPLRYVLIVPFILQIVGAVGLVGCLSYQNGEKAVRELATQLENEICDRIEQHLDRYLTTPKQINQINLDAIELDLLNLSDFQNTGNYFWKQMQVFNVGYNSFANPKGEFMQQINANTSITILLCIVAFLVATIIGVLTARWVIKPILQLNTSAKKIAKGEWEQTPEINRSDELGELAKSFETMAKQLQTSFSVLEAKNAQMQVLNEALSDSESRLTQFLEAIPVGVFIIDAEGEPYYTNQIGQQILGQGVISKDKPLRILAEVNAKQLSEVYHFYLAGTDQLYPSDRLPISRALLGESSRVDDVEVRRCDKIIPIEVLGEPIYDESGNLAFAIATFFDITQRKQAENLLAEYNRSLEAQVKKRTDEFQQVIEELQTTQEQLIQSQKIAAQEQQAAVREAARSAAANLAKSEFLANMSHELRTPLNAILGFTQIMSHDHALSTEHQQNLVIINRAGEHLLNLINDILAMSKIEAGRITLNLSSFDLIRLLENLEEMLRFRATSKGLELVFQYTSQLPQYIQADESKLRQVLLNLLGNAIKFTDTGKVILRVGMRDMGERIFPHPPHLFFEVTDTGRGIAPQELDLLFEAFGQTETGRKSQQGTGLGLAISRKYVELMGGDISVSSIIGEGSKFAFDIQIGLATASEIQIKEIRRQVLSLAPAQSEYRILVVDDSTDSRLMLVKILTSIGFAVQEAANGTEAIALWQKWQPHLILMDMRMPIMDGYEATKIIKAREEILIPNRKTIIIALTANAFEEQREAIIKAGCDDYINKPFREEKLLEKLSEYLGVQYIYQEDNYQIANTKQKITESILKLADLVPLLSEISPEWTKQVYTAAAQCSDDLILELMEEIPSENAILRDFIKNLAHDFQFDKIMELTSIAGVSK